MISTFWDTYGILFNDYLDKDKIITGEYYMASLNVENQEETHSHVKEKKVSFHQDNAVSKVDENNG